MGDDTVDPVTLAFAAPSPGASFMRDQLSAATGALVASVPVELAITGAPARVTLAVADADAIDVSGATTTAELAAETATLVATAYDDAGAVLATAMVDVGSSDATPADCHAALAMYQLDYTVGPARMGVVDPVTVTPPINGIAYRGVGAANPRTSLYGDCTLMLSLAKATPFYRARGVVEVTDYGIYNYRCIGGGTPPCQNGISQHAYATAIDLAAFTTSDGETAVVNDDWVIDPNSEETCEAPTEPGKDAFLHELICALKTAEIWNIVLTPNYNAAHRDHFHVDLSPGSDFIERVDVTPSPGPGQPAGADLHGH